jgi:hypothetical protein
MATDSLARVFWIGGGCDAGKTSTARALGERHGWQVYHYDRFDRLTPPGHYTRIDPGRQPYMHALRQQIDDLDARWVNITPQGLFARWCGIAAERFPMALEDLRALPPGPIVAEGYGLLPALVAPVLSSPRQAIWLVPTEEFKRATFARREATGEKGASRWKSSDPERWRANHIGRDLLIGDLIREQARALDLKLLEVDGSGPLEATIAAVEAHFALT